MHLKFPAPLFYFAFFWMACSCNGPAGNRKSDKTAQTAADSSRPAENPSAAANDSHSSRTDPDVPSEKTSPAVQNNADDSMLSRLKGIASMLGKSDSGAGGSKISGSNMDSMLTKMQNMLGGKSGNMGNGIAKSLLNFQLGQMSDKNPVKAVANGMMAAEANGTAGPSKTYTAAYEEEQPADYSMPVSGNGNSVELQYTGGNIAENKKDGLWKNLYVNTNKEIKWNVYSESYVQSSVLNMKVHETSLANANTGYSIIMNEQYKKYNKQQKADLGKNESAVQVQKIGNEKMFGYNSVHVKITYTLKALGQTAHMQNDEWYSSDVPGAQFLSPLIFESHSPAVVKKIMAAGCSGILIKSVIKSSGSFQLIQLSRILQKDQPDSLFTLPENYQEDKNTALYGIQ